ncbi:MAG: nuclease, partial [Actinomycetota bacterium]
ETGCLVLSDGRLGFLDATASPVVGVVKRFVRAYLDPQHDGLLPLLGPGERTPLFGLIYEGQPLERFAWYTRLVPTRPVWHDHAGLVRCEVRAGVGLDEARALADHVSGLLPRFAGRPTDPRYPQNLAPVGGLEARLQHRMGHRGLIRRAITAWLTGG